MFTIDFTANTRGRIESGIAVTFAYNCVNASDYSTLAVESFSLKGQCFFTSRRVGSFAAKVQRLGFSLQ